MTVASKMWNFELKYLPDLRQCLFLRECVDHRVKMHVISVGRIWWEDSREAKCPDRRQQFQHEQARKHQAHNVQCLVCLLPFLLTKTLLTGMLAYVQLNQEVREDTGYVEGDKDDNGIVAPFGGEEFLYVLTGLPNPRIHTMDVEDVLADVV